MQIGMILVLFILLVIVTSIFCFSPIDDDNDSPFVQSTVGFDVVNNSSYRLRFSTRTGPSSIPSPSNLFPGESHHYEVRLGDTLTEFVTVTYNVYDQQNTNIGQLVFAMEAAPGSGYFRILKNNSPVRTETGFLSRTLRLS
ncbi:hypothetical protein [Paenibacillus herberti]|uniref:hypothetical protein n=1 Tax=Paenibacillus herberti TaxID=1619309 RepID=UPI001131E6D4|nr:hypothetical protein [Paenibacillus herberti]